MVVICCPSATNFCLLVGESVLVKTNMKYELRVTNTGNILPTKLIYWVTGRGSWLTWDFSYDWAYQGRKCPSLNFY